MGDCIWQACRGDYDRSAALVILIHRFCGLAAEGRTHRPCRASRRVAFRIGPARRVGLPDIDGLRRPSRRYGSLNVILRDHPGARAADHLAHRTLRDHFGRTGRADGGAHQIIVGMLIGGRVSVHVCIGKHASGFIRERARSERQPARGNRRHRLVPHGHLCGIHGIGAGIGRHDFRLRGRGTRSGDRLAPLPEQDVRARVIFVARGDPICIHHPGYLIPIPRLLQQSAGLPAQQIQTRAGQ